MAEQTYTHKQLTQAMSAIIDRTLSDLVNLGIANKLDIDEYKRNVPTLVTQVLDEGDTKPTNKDATSLKAHEAYCNEIDRISVSRTGLCGCDIIDNETQACKIIQDGWANGTAPNVVVDALIEAKNKK